MSRPRRSRPSAPCRTSASARSTSASSRPTEALAAFTAGPRSGIATTRPGSIGRAEALVALGRRSEAADALDRASAVQLAAGRTSGLARQRLSAPSIWPNRGPAATPSRSSSAGCLPCPTPEDAEVLDLAPTAPRVADCSDPTRRRRLRRPRRPTRSPCLPSRRMRPTPGASPTPGPLSCAPPGRSPRPIVRSPPSTRVTRPWPHAGRRRAASRAGDAVPRSRLATGRGRQARLLGRLAELRRPRGHRSSRSGRWPDERLPDDPRLAGLFA